MKSERELTASGGVERSVVDHRQYGTAYRQKGLDVVIYNIE